MRSTAVLFLVLFVRSVSWGQETTVKEITPLQVDSMMKYGHMTILDCNEPDMYQEAHVPGAQLVVYDALPAEALPADHDSPLLFYCYSPECPAGSMAAATAVGMGYTKVYSMVAGITGWMDAGLRTEP